MELTAHTKAELRREALLASERIQCGSGYPDLDKILRGAEQIAAFMIFEPTVTLSAGKAVLGRVRRAKARK